MQAVLGERVPAGSTKGFTGHALGAAGIVEAAICLIALTDGFLPGTLNCRTVDAQIRSRILLDPVAATPAHVMTNSFGFGGNNCTLVLGRRA